MSNVAGDDSSTGTTLAPGTALGGLAPPPQPLPSRGQLVTPATQNSTLMVKKKTVDRTILQKKVGWQDGRVHVLWPGAAAI